MLKWQDELPSKAGLWWRRRVGERKIHPVTCEVVIDGVAYDDDFDPIRNRPDFQWAGPDIEE